MVILSISCIVLAVLCLVFFIYIAVLKREMDNIKRELARTRDKGYNRQITISLFHQSFTDMVSELNKNLDYQKQLKFKTEQAEGALKQSISDIAHDLRTPLTVVKGNLQLLDKDESLSEQNRRYLKLCRDKLDVLKTMVDDFFEMSVLESDDTLVSLSEVNVTNLLMQFVIDHEALIREHGLSPDIRLPEKTVTILADEHMLSRMFSNLLNNIMKYGQDSFVLSVKLTNQEDMCYGGMSGKEAAENTKKTVCVITFSNKICHDIEIEPEHLFERTYRGNKARSGEGAGLGLYIVKLLAQKQGAKVYADIKDEQLGIHMEFAVK